MNNSFSEIVASSQLTLVDFYADWCGPCQMMKPILVELKQKMGEKVKIITINVDKNQALANKYQVRGVPTLMFFRENQMLWRQSGVVQCSDLEKLVLNFIKS